MKATVLFGPKDLRVTDLLVSAVITMDDVAKEISSRELSSKGKVLVCVNDKL